VESAHATAKAAQVSRKASEFLTDDLFVSGECKAVELYLNLQTVREPGMRAQTIQQTIRDRSLPQMY
jgi:hypothetical protein